jgi:hypothetical protein
MRKAAKASIVNIENWCIQCKSVFNPSICVVCCFPNAAKIAFRPDLESLIAESELFKDDETIVGETLAQRCNSLAESAATATFQEISIETQPDGTDTTASGESSFIDSSQSSGILRTLGNRLKRARRV